MNREVLKSGEVTATTSTGKHLYFGFWEKTTDASETYLIFTDQHNFAVLKPSSQSRLYSKGSKAKEKFLIFHLDLSTSIRRTPNFGFTFETHLICVREIFEVAFHSSQQIVKFFKSPEPMLSSEVSAFCRNGFSI